MQYEFIHLARIEYRWSNYEVIIKWLSHYLNITGQGKPGESLSEDVATDYGASKPLEAIPGQYLNKY